MAVTEAGMMMLARPVFRKMSTFMIPSRMPLSKHTLVKAEQSMKAPSPTVVTEAGTTMLPASPEPPKA
jgi:hypothetical protein